MYVGKSIARVLGRATDFGIPFWGKRGDHPLHECYRLNVMIINYLCFVTLMRKSTPSIIVTSTGKESPRAWMLMHK